MDLALGLLGVLGFIAGIVSLAALVTFAVIKVDALVRRARGHEAP